MKLGVLFSGGKDSCFALYRAMQKEEVVCLITLRSENKESYMFHTPNISLARLQAKAIGLPLVQKRTEGKEDEELKDLRSAILRAKKRFGIQGVVTGAIESIYQASRIHRICMANNLLCINPLWKTDQLQLLQELLKTRFSVMITGVFAYPLDKKWLGRIIDQRAIQELEGLCQKFQISPSGEGGEIETTVLDAPYFLKSIRIVKKQVYYKNHAGTMDILKAELKEK